MLSETLLHTRSHIRDDIVFIFTAMRTVHEVNQFVPVVNYLPRQEWRCNLCSRWETVPAVAGLDAVPSSRKSSLSDFPVHRVRFL